MRAVLRIAELRRLRRQLTVLLPQLLLLLEERILLVDGGALVELRIASLRAVELLALAEAGVASVLRVEPVLLTELRVMSFSTAELLVASVGRAVLLLASVGLTVLRVAPVGLTELLVRRRGLATVLHGRAAELLVRGRGLLLGGAVDPPGGFRVAAVAGVGMIRDGGVMPVRAVINAVPMALGGGPLSAGALRGARIRVPGGARSGGAPCARDRTGACGGTCAVVGADVVVAGVGRPRGAIRSIAGRRLLVHGTRRAAAVPCILGGGIVGQCSVSSGAIVADPVVRTAVVRDAVVVADTVTRTAVVGRANGVDPVIRDALTPDPVVHRSVIAGCAVIPGSAVIPGCAVITDCLVIAGRIVVGRAVVIAVVRGRGGTCSGPCHAGRTGCCGSGGAGAVMLPLVTNRSLVPGAVMSGAVVPGAICVLDVVTRSVTVAARCVMVAARHAVLVADVLVADRLVPGVGGERCTVTAAARCVVGGVRLEAIGLGQPLLHAAALLLDRGTLLLRVGTAALGRDPLLLGLLRLPLGLESDAVRLQLGLARLQIALLDGRFLGLGLLAELGGAPAIGLLLPGLLALRGQHAHDDQDDQHDEHQQDDPDDDGGGQFHGRLLAVDSSARCARRSSCVYR